MSPLLAIALGAILLLALLLFWLIHTTEGVFLGASMVRFLYNRSAKGYDDLKEFDRQDELSFLANPLLHRLEESFGPRARVLDIATGTARLPLALLDIPFYEGQIVGIDASAGMLSEARRKRDAKGLQDRLELIEAFAAPLPFEDQSFDAVCSLEALEFLPDKGAALSEIWRVLKPNGVLMLSNRVGLEAKFFGFRYRSPQAFESDVAEYGFAEIETKPWQDYYDLVWARKA